MIYIIQEEDPPHRIKVGYSANVKVRVATLASILPQKIKLLKVMEGELEDEQCIHSRLAEFRVAGTKEWYHPYADLMDVLDTDGTLEAAC